MKRTKNFRKVCLAFLGSNELKNKEKNHLVANEFWSHF